MTVAMTAAVAAMPVRNGGLRLQRSCACGQHTTDGATCESCAQEKTEAPAIVHDVLHSAGDPLDPPTRNDMERRFHADFSRVRVHSDEAAKRSAKAVNARAYTVGRHIVFGPGSNTRSGTPRRHLLAHELTHVVQQRAADVPAGPIALSRGDEHAEYEAEANAATLPRNVAPAVSMTSPTLQRKDADEKAKEPLDDDKDDDDRVGERAFPGVTQIHGQDPQSLLRFDTVTVIELGADDWCVGCLDMRDDLSQLVAEYTAKPEKVGFRAYSLNQQVGVNKKFVRRIKAETKEKGVPQTFVYVEYKQVKAYTEGYKQGYDYKGEIKGIVKSASTPGVFTGMKWGAIAGGVAGGIAGNIAGALISKSAGGSLLGGLIGGAIGAAAGLGLGALIGGLANKDIGKSRLSDQRKKEVKEYVFGTDSTNGIHQNKAIRGDSAADDLARDAADMWYEDPDSLALDAVDRRLLILEMLDGHVSRADKRGILKILEASGDNDLLIIFNGVGPTPSDRKKDTVSIEDLKAEFGSDEKDVLDRIVKRLRGDLPIAPPLASTKDRFINKPFANAKMKTAYENTQKKKMATEIAGAFFDSGDPQNPGYFEKEFEGTTTHMEELVRDARQTPAGSNFQPVLASFHTHPGFKPRPGEDKPAISRLAPSAADLTSAKANPNMGVEHYVIDPWVVHLITQEGTLIELGQAKDLLSVTPPAKPPGLESTVEPDKQYNLAGGAP